MKEIRNVGIIGRGAVGVIFGKIINDFLGYHHTYFIIDESRQKRYQTEGLLYNGVPLDLHYVTPDQAIPLDLILIATKYTALHNVIPLIKGFMHQETIILSAINGIVSEDDLRQAYGRRSVVRCIAQKMSSVYDGQRVIAENIGELVFGAEDIIDNENVEALCHFFDLCHLPYVCSSDIVHDAYSKLMLNCAINQVSAAWNVGYGGYQEGAPYRDLIIAIMNEVRQVAACEGIVLSDEEVASWLEAVDAFPPDSMPSMRQDVLAKRPTEVALFGETICALGKKHHIPTPLNDELVRRIKAIENSYERK